MNWHADESELNPSARDGQPSLTSHFSTWVTNELETASIHDRLDESNTDGREDSAAQQVFEQLSLDDLLEVYQCLDLLERVWPATDGLPRKIGPYQLIRQLGRGGMGEVWQAEQHEPIHRKLAIKLVRPQLISETIRARFASERKLLARLEHPNIARVLDAGSFEQGRLFLAMELVDGTTLTRYCNQRKLDMRQRLRLLIEVCSAVAYAHQNAIIHRDLKPSNILIQEIDDRAVPKVIDFGLAKLLGDPADESFQSSVNSQHDQTLHGQLLGTVEYMSPEQATAGKATVDTRTDIYSLGVLLYQLLTNELPIRQDFASPNSTVETLQRIRTEIPKPPSQVLQTEKSKDTRSRIGTISQRYRQPLSEELDWIAMKALQKTPADRYATVQEFSADLQRFLNHEPLAAGPSTTRYRLQKYLQKNRKLLAALSLLVLTLLLGIIGTSWGWIQSSKAQAKAESNWTRAKQSNKILTDIFSDLDIATAEFAEQPLKMVLAQRLVAAGNQLAESDVGDPLDVAEMQLKLGHSLNALGFPDDALPICQTAFETFDNLIGITDLATRSAARELSLAYQGTGEPAAANKALQPVLQYCRDRLPEFAPETLQTMDQLAALKYFEGDYQAALPLQQQAYQWRQSLHGDDDFETVKSAAGLGSCYVALFQHERAIPILEQSLAFCRDRLPRDHPETIRILSDLSWAYGRMDDGENRDASIRMAHEAYELAMEVFGPHHRQSYEALMQIGLAEFLTGAMESAETTLKTATKGLAETCGSDHPKLVIGNSVLAKVYQRSEKWTLAIPLIESSFAVRKSKLPPQHPTVLHGYLELADAYNSVGEFEKSQQHLLEALDAQAPDSRERWLTELKIGNTFFELGQFNSAVAHIQIAKQGLEHTSGRYDFDTGLAIADLGKALAGNHEFESAIQLLQEYRQEILIEVGPRSPMSAIITAQLGIVLGQAGRVDEGIELMELIVNSGRRLKQMDYLVRELRAAYRSAGLPDRLEESLQFELQFYRRRLEPDSALLAQRLAELGSEAVRFEHWETAAALLRESGKIRRAISGKATEPGTTTVGLDAWDLAITEFQVSVAELAIELEAAAANENQNGAEPEAENRAPNSRDENTLGLLRALDDQYAELTGLFEHIFPNRKLQLRSSIGSLMNVLAAASMVEQSSQWDARLQTEFGIRTSD